MTVSFWLNQPATDDGSLKSKRAVAVCVVVVVLDGAVTGAVVGVIVVVTLVAVVVVGVIVAVTVVVVAASDAHALRSDMANVVSDNFVSNAISEFYH
jgi:hypothetical protein